MQLPSADDGSTVVLARDGTPLRAFADRDGVWRYPVTAKDVSPLYLKALLTYEDRWFYRHPGVNPYALARGLGGGLLHGHIVSGGSTLTMQVARIIEPIPHTFGGKLLQILRALQLEAHLSKAQILDPVPQPRAVRRHHPGRGGGLVGVSGQAGKAAVAGRGRACSRCCRNHPAACARIAIPRPRAMRATRCWHACATRAHGRAAQVRDAAIEPVVARSLRSPLNAALLAERLHQQQPQARRIRTTIDANLQRAVEQRVIDYLGRLPAHTSAALLVVDNATLEARVYVGTGDFADPARHGYVDMMRARAFARLHAQAVPVRAGAGRRADHLAELAGRMRRRISAATGRAISTRRSAGRSAWPRRCSVRSTCPRWTCWTGSGRTASPRGWPTAASTSACPTGAQPNLSIILGGAATRLESLVGAYTAFANGGVAGTPRYTRDQPARPRRLLSPGAAWIVRDILAHNPADVEGAPLAGAINRHAAVAWKTGTSYGYRDAWSIGVTDRWTLGVWIGRPDGTPSPGQYGAVTALPLLFQVVDMLPQRGGQAHAARPASVTPVEICWPLGGTVAATPVAQCRQRHTAWTLDGALPPTFAERGPDAWASGRLALRVDAQGRRLSGGCHGVGEHTVELARWPALLTAWLDARDRLASALPPLAPGCADDSLDATVPIRIAGLANGATLRRPPNSRKALQVTLRALGASGPVQWLLDGRLQGESRADAGIALQLDTPGEHAITALARDGAFDSLRLRVAR